MSRINSQSKPAQLISTAKAAERLDVSSNTVRSLIAQGLIKGYKVGRFIKLDSEAVENFITEIATGV